MRPRPPAYVVAALLILFGGCKPQQEEAPTPSNPNAFSKTELTALKESSEQGNNDAMYRLAIYYLFYEQDDKQGWSWMEKSAEAGNLDAQEAVLDYLANRGNPEEMARGEMLRQKWRGAPAKAG